jgi:hypothetical protein
MGVIALVTNPIRLNLHFVLLLRYRSIWDEGKTAGSQVKLQRFYADFSPLTIIDNKTKNPTAVDYWQRNNPLLCPGISTFLQNFWPPPWWQNETPAPDTIVFALSRLLTSRHQGPAV